MVQWLRLCAPSAGCPGLIPSQGTRSHMLQLKISSAETKIPHCQINCKKKVAIKKEEEEVVLLTNVSGHPPTQGLNKQKDGGRVNLFSLLEQGHLPPPASYIHALVLRSSQSDGITSLASLFLQLSDSRL